MPMIFSFLVIALMVGALVDIITRDNAQVKHLPKMAWAFIVILLPLIGSALWFALGREYAGGGLQMPRVRRERSAPRPQSQWSPPVDQRSTEQQIADLDREIEEWRLMQEIEKRKRERGEA